MIAKEGSSVLVLLCSLADCLTQGGWFGRHSLVLFQGCTEWFFSCYDWQLNDFWTELRGIKWHAHQHVLPFTTIEACGTPRLPCSDMYANTGPLSGTSCIFSSERSFFAHSTSLSLDAVQKNLWNCIEFYTLSQRAVRSRQPASV